MTLPSTYMEVEYIESSGTQYIETNVTPTINTLSKLKFRPLEVTGHAIFGYTSPDNNDYRVFNYSSSIYYDFGNSRVSGSSCSSGNDYEWEVGNYYVKDLTTSTILISGSTKSSFTASNTVKLNGDGTYSKVRWYYAKIYEDGTLIRDFVPCYRKSDNVIGMYDLANNEFYTNSGTGTFTKGPDVGPVTGQISPKKIYIWVEQQGPVYTTFDFTQLSRAELVNAGWVLTNGMAVDSNGLYATSSSGNERAYYNTQSFTSNDVVSIKTVFTSTSFQDWNGSTSTGFDGSSNNGNFYGTYKAFMNSNQYSFRWQWWSTGGSIGQVNWVPNTLYEETLTYDFPNGTLTTKITTQADPNTTIITATANISSFVSAIVQEHLYIRMEKPPYSVKSISYNIS